MPILLLSIFLKRSSIVAAAAKCFIFRKRTHSEVIYANTDSFNCSTKSYMEKADSWFKPKLSSHLHYFDARLFWVSSSPRKKFRLLHSSAETKTLFIVQISRVRFCSFDLVLTFCVVMGLTPCTQLSWEGLLQKAQGWTLCLLFTLFMLGASAIIQFLTATYVTLYYSISLY